MVYSIFLKEGDKLPKINVNVFPVKDY